MYSLAATVGLGSASVLKKLSNLALQLCNADSAGVSLIESAESGTLFRWKALSGAVEKYEGGSSPRDWSPCCECLKAGRAVLYSYPGRYFTWFEELGLPVVEGLVIPMIRGALPVGTIWIVSHTSTCRFDAEHLRILKGLGGFAANVLKPQDSGCGCAEEARTDREIVWSEYVRRITERDELALEALVEETRALVFATALRVVSFPSDAEEVAADIYARVWMTAGNYDSSRAGVGAWLVTMAHRRAIDLIRTRSVRARTEAALIRRCSSLADPEALMNASETKTRLQTILQGLPFEQRRAIELFYFSDLPVAGIAKKLGHPIGTVKTRLRSGIMRLRRLSAALETTT